MVAICDPDQARSAAFAKTIKDPHGYYRDIVAHVRRLMDRKDLDIVSIARCRSATRTARSAAMRPWVRRKVPQRVCRETLDKKRPFRDGSA